MRCARLGDKIAAKLLAEEVGVPVAAWSGGPVETDADALAARRTRSASRSMIKAAAGGGGRGIRIVNSEAELLPGLERARDEAKRAFGDASVLMERLVTGARHVEVQVIADHHGTGWAVGVRDCSVQRRSQKLIEESASPALDAEQEVALRRSAVDLVLAAGYRNVGTVEFLYQPEERALSFLEVNTRLQVEHPVTEAVDRPRPGEAADPHRGGRAARGRPAGGARARDRGPRQRRGRGARLRPGAGHGGAARPADRVRGSAWTRASPRGT